MFINSGLSPLFMRRFFGCFPMPSGLLRSLHSALPANIKNAHLFETIEDHGDMHEGQLCKHGHFISCFLA